MHRLGCWSSSTRAPGPGAAEWTCERRSRSLPVTAPTSSSHNGFGSVAAGSAGEHSDIDVILVRDTALPFFDSREADRWLSQAEDDLRFARLGLREGYYAQVCFQ